MYKRFPREYKNCDTKNGDLRYCAIETKFLDNEEFSVSEFTKIFIGETVREIHLDHHWIIYHPQAPLTIVLVLKEARSESLPIALILDCIFRTFLENYHEYLEETRVKHFIDKQVFTSFTATLDTLLQDYLSVEAFLHHQFRIVNQGKSD